MKWVINLFSETWKISVAHLLHLPTSMVTAKRHFEFFLKELLNPEDLFQGKRLEISQSEGMNINEWFWLPERTANRWYLQMCYVLKPQRWVRYGCLGWRSFAFLWCNNLEQLKKFWTSIQFCILEMLCFSLSNTSLLLQLVIKSRTIVTWIWACCMLYSLREKE